MQLDEIVNYIENDQKLTIDADAKKRMLGYESADGQRHYYGLPQYEWSNSLTYDVNYFEEKGFYFAKPDFLGTRKRARRSKQLEKLP